jgi:hypothetical protein
MQERYRYTILYLHLYTNVYILYNGCMYMVALPIGYRSEMPHFTLKRWEIFLYLYKILMLPDPLQLFPYNASEFVQFRMAYGTSGRKKTSYGIPCRRISWTPLLIWTVWTITDNVGIRVKHLHVRYVQLFNLSVKLLTWSALWQVDMALR